MLGPFWEPPLCPQVSHHPPVSAFHVSNRKDGFCISGSVTAKSRFYGERDSPLPRAWEMGEDWAPGFSAPQTLPGGRVYAPPHLSWSGATGW